MQQVDSRLSLDLYLSGKKIQINIVCINERAKKEIETTLAKRDLDIKDILKAYIQKSQEYADLEDRLQGIIDKMEL